MRKLRTAGALALLLAAVSLSVPGCSRDRDPWQDNLARPEDARLAEDAILAFYDVYVSETASDAPEGSRLVVVSEDGSVQAVRIGTMTGGTPVFAGGGLYFADKHNDYVLTGQGLKTFPNPKPWDQLAGLPAGDGFVAVFNHGFAEGGYRSLFVHTTIDGVGQSRFIEGYYPYIAMCDGTVYGLALITGRLREQLDGRQQPERIGALVKIAPTESGEAEVIAWSPYIDFAANGKNQTCVANSMAFIASYEDQSGTVRGVVVRWNVKTGEYHEAALVDENGSPIGPADFYEAFQDGASIRDGAVEWLHRANGTIMSTDIETGRTRVLYSIGLPTDDGGFTVVRFSESHCHVLRDPFDGHSPVVYKEFDRRTGAETRSLELDGAGRARYGIQGFAVR